MSEYARRPTARASKPLPLTRPCPTQRFRRLRWTAQTGRQAPHFQLSLFLTEGGLSVGTQPVSQMEQGEAAPFLDHRAIFRACIVEATAWTVQLRAW